jgi:hypothetical protein
MAIKAAKASTRKDTRGPATRGHRRPSEEPADRPGSDYGAHSSAAPRRTGRLGGCQDLRRDVHGGE